jgi:hypothetical protein
LPYFIAFLIPQSFLNSGERSILRSTATEDRQFAATPQGRQMRTVRESVEIDALRVQVFTSSDFDNLVFGLNSTLPLRHPMGPGWAALSALGFIISASTRGVASLCPGLSPHRAFSAKSPSTTSQSILENSLNSCSFREIRVSLARLPAFRFFPDFGPSAFSL